MYDHSTGQTRMITAWPENLGMVPGKDNKYRFQFHFPTFLSPHDPSVLYIAAHVVFRSTDEGHSWTIISPDLTTNDVSKMSELHGGPISIQVVNPFNMGSILALDESPLQEGLLWAGSDDGLVHITKDGGENWENVTPPDLPSWAIITVIDPLTARSRHGLPFRHPPQDGRHQALPVQDTRLWGNLDQDYRKHSPE